MTQKTNQELEAENQALLETVAELRDGLTSIRHLFQSLIYQAPETHPYWFKQLGTVIKATVAKLPPEEAE